MTLQIVIAGAGGRMGREVIATAAGLPDVRVIGGLLAPGSAASGAWHAMPGLPIPCAALDGERSTLLAGVSALIDFSTPVGTVAHARACATAGVPFVSGTTGLTEADLGVLRIAARRIPVYYARNMSLGIAALLAALPAIEAALDGFDVEIVETHHRHKVDAPSGTALALAEAIVGSLGASLDSHASYGRRGIAPRQPEEIGIHAVRGGGNPGEHQIIFSSDGEELRLSHRSFSRRAYALGALQAARFVADRAPGFYGLHDLTHSCTEANTVLVEQA